MRWLVGWVRFVWQVLASAVVWRCVGGRRERREVSSGR